MPFSSQVPTASVTVEGACALNRVRWASGGREVAVGDSEGHVWIYDVGEVITQPLNKTPPHQSLNKNDVLDSVSIFAFWRSIS